MRASADRPPIRLGLRANLAQFSLLVGVNALVGGMVGQERALLPLIARDEFHLPALTTILTFLFAFGSVKALTNLVAGALADRHGRKPVLIAGWLIGIPIPLLLMWAPSWGWIVVANVLLGVNQGLAWSMTVTMKIDLAGPDRRGFAMGLNEAAGYGAVAITAAFTGFVAARTGLRPEPFFIGLAYVGIGLGASVIFVRETRSHVLLEAQSQTHTERPSSMSVFVATSFRNRTLSACSQAGLVNNLNDGMAWGLLPIWFSMRGASIGTVGVLSALYPAVWSVGQLATGTLSDRIGRKGLIASGMLIQAAAIAIIAATRAVSWWALGAVLLGAGTAMVYPTLLAAISDVAAPAWRASAVGVYRFWRDAGFALGAVLTGLLADAFGAATAIWAVAGLTAASGALVIVRMRETLQVHVRGNPA